VDCPWSLRPGRRGDQASPLAFPSTPHSATVGPVPAGEARATVGVVMPKVLLVEDLEDNRVMLTRRLERRGFEVALAADGEEGCMKARSERPDLILMDLGLPGISGYDATRQLKGAPETQSIPIIALTARAMVDELTRAREAGCDDCDTKPVDLARLLDKIRKLLERRSSP